jgi:hypothetical protein
MRDALPWSLLHYNAADWLDPADLDEAADRNALERWHQARAEWLAANAMA